MSQLLHALPTHNRCRLPPGRDGTRRVVSPRQARLLEGCGLDEIQGWPSSYERPCRQMPFTCGQSCVRCTDAHACAQAPVVRCNCPHVQRRGLLHRQRIITHRVSHSAEGKSGGGNQTTPLLHRQHEGNALRPQSYMCNSCAHGPRPLAPSGSTLDPVATTTSWRQKRDDGTRQRCVPGHACTCITGRARKRAPPVRNKSQRYPPAPGAPACLRLAVEFAAAGGVCISISSRRWRMKPTAVHACMQLLNPDVTPYSP